MHNTFNRRVLLGTGLSAGALAALAACSGSGGGGGNQLSLWSRDSQGNGVMEPTIRASLAAFDKANNTKTDVQFLTLADSSQKELAALTAGGLPTLGEQGQDVTMQFASGGHLSQVDDLRTAMKDQLSENVPGPAFTEYDGHTYGLPWWLETHVLFYHKDLVEQAGVALPKTWSEWLTFTAGLTKGSDQYGFVVDGKSSSNPLGQILSPLAASAGATVLDSTGKLVVKADPFVGALEFLQKMYKQGMPPATPTYDSTSAQQLFITKKVASYLGTGSLWVAIKASNPDLIDNLGAIVAPAFDASSTSRAFMGGFELFAFSKGKGADHAMALLKHMFDPTFYGQMIQAGGGYLALPALASASNADTYASGLGKTLIEQLKTSCRYGGPDYSSSPYMGKAETTGVFSQPVVDVWSGKATPQDAAATMVTALQALASTS